jgi:type I restriction enzyme, S subunit
MSMNNIQDDIKKTFIEELPENWTLCQLGDVMRLKNGYAFKSKDYSSDGLPLVRISDINNGKVSLEKAARIPEDKANLDFVVQPGDLLIAMSGATTGKTGVYSGKRPCLQNQRVGNFIIISQDAVDKKYRNYYVASLRKEIEEAAYGGAQPNISAKGIEAFDFPLAPLNEQKRIVAEIEKQFSRLDEAVENLKRVKANLKRYRASVLKAAVEGKLTEEWRGKHPDVESADKLLERILVERRKKWEEAELAKMKAKGKLPKDDKWKKKYKEPKTAETENLPDIPPTWLWARLDSVTEIKGGITKDSKRKIKKAKELPYLRVANVQRGYLDLDKIKYIKVSEDNLPELLLERGDILFNEGGDRDKLGRGWIWEGQIRECTYQNHVFRARLFLKEMPGKLFSWYGNTFGQQYFMAKGKQTTNLASINKTMLSALPIPLPPFDEQVILIKKIEGRLSMIDAVEKEVDASLKRADLLRQSVLKSAFSGLLFQNH